MQEEPAEVEKVQDENVSKDDLKWILDRTTSHIQAADTKNGILVAALAVIVAVLFPGVDFSAQVNAILEAGCLQLFIAIVLVLSLFWLIVSLMASVFPRIGKKGAVSSVTYFGGVVSHGSSERYAEKLDTANLRADLIVQIYANSLIAKKKMFWHSSALVSFAVLLTCMVALFVFGMGA